jgi:hypothetical protein
MPAITLPVKHLALLSLVLAGSASMCLYWSRYTDAVLIAMAPSSGLQVKALSDFFPSWYATRELLLHHRNPYGAEVNRELQIAYYGRQLDPSRPEERRDQQRFVYPLYFVLFVAPTATVDFSAARIIVRWVLAACAAVNVLLWLRFVRLRLSPFALTVLFALDLTSTPVFQNLSLLQPFLLPACFIAGAAAALVSGRLFLTGALLALATVKPQVSLLPIAWFALWLCGDWKRRQTVFWGFTATLAALVLASEWLLPGWLIQYPNVLMAYAEYRKAKSFFALLLPSPLHWPATILASAIVAEFCWRVRRQPENSAAFAIALSLVLTLAVSIIPAMEQPFNHVLLLPAVLLGIRYWPELRRGNVLTRSATFFFGLCALLPWPLAIATVVTRDPAWLLKMWSVPLAASMALPLAAFGILILLRGLILFPPPSLSTSSDPSRPAHPAVATRQP